MQLMNTTQDYLCLKPFKSLKPTTHRDIEKRKVVKIFFLMTYSERFRYRLLKHPNVNKCILLVFLLNK